MDSNDCIITEIFKEVLFSEEEKQNILNHFETVQVKKGEFILNEGEQVNHQYFVLNGCLRTYFTDKQGKEYTLQFAIKDWWVSDFTAFFSASKAIMTIECIQEATLYKISKQSTEDLYKDIPQLETFFRIKMEKAFASFQKRILGNLALPAKERYITFINTYPNIEKSVKNYHIASYLGIATESLSRIRKDIATD